MVVTSASAASAQTALAVLTKNAAPVAGPAAAPERQRPPERGAAVVIDARTAELAEACRNAAERAAERDGTAPGDAETAARKRYADDLRRKGIQDFEESVVQHQMSLQQTKERIRIYEETGELMSVRGDGTLGKRQPQDRFRSAEEEQQYVEHLRKSVGYMEKVLPELQADAARMRAEYESRGKA